jgi:hypothetical protein
VRPSSKLGGRFLAVKPKPAFSGGDFCDCFFPQTVCGSLAAGSALDAYFVKC